MIKVFDEDQVWDFFRRLVVDNEGKIDLVKLKKEFSDYFHLLTNACVVYSAITGGAITDTNHDAGEVIIKSEEYIKELLQIAEYSNLQKIDELTDMNNKLLDQMVQ